VGAEPLRVTDPVAAAAEVRARVPAPASVTGAVAEIVERVAAEGDAAVREYGVRFDGPGAADWPLRVDPLELSGALAALDPAVRAGLEVAIANVRTVALAALGSEAEVELPQGQRIVLREVPVRRAAIYVPGGRAPYPSTVVMGAVTAQAAGVEEVVVCAPPGTSGSPDPVILAACALVGVEEVYRVGGAHAIAALAHGTGEIARVDVIAGPGNLYVQEAKRLVSGVVGIDGFAGPSDVLVVMSDGADPALVALDLRAQAEHGEDSLVAAVSDSPELLAAVGAAMGGRAALVQVPDLAGALAFAEAFAPEHLELVGAEAEALAGRVRSAGCVFVGATGATAFGDYVCGSNHILPTTGAARFASGVSPRTFRRRVSEVHIGTAAAALAAAGAPVARAEGYEIHAESMEARAIGDNGAQR
jgi:histidinol dehydrogenase